MHAAPAAVATERSTSSSLSTPLRLLVVNGNTTAELTASLAIQAHAMLQGAAAIHAVTVAFGPAYIASRAEAAVSAHAVLETVEREAAQAAEAGAPFDACLLACFGEPGIGAVRERVAMPVVGMAEAAILTALQRGDRYAIVTVGQRWPGMLREQIRQWGLESRCAGIIALPGNALDYVARSPESAAVVSHALDAAVEQGADVIIVAGAALAGYLPSLPRLPGVPLIDSYRAALAQVQALALLDRAQRVALGR